MQKTLTALVSLQELDLRLDELIDERGDLPGIVSELENNIESKNNQKNALEEEIKQAKLRIGEIDLFNETADEKLAKYNDQLYQVKTNREYDAITVEIEMVQQQQKEFNSEIQTLTANLAEKESTLETIGSEISTLEKELEENKVELDERLSETAEEEEKLNSQREKTIKKIKREVLTSYETIRQARNGRGIALVENGTCGGCFSFVPPQKIANIRKMDTMLECEYCGRILVWVG